MQYFQVYFRRQIYILSIFSLLLILSFIGFLVFNRVTRTGSTELRSQLAGINRLIGAIHDHTRIDSPASLRTLQESVLQVKDILPPESLPPEISQTLSLLYNMHDEATMRQAIGLFGETARRLSSNYYKIETRNDYILITFAFAMAFMLGFLILFSVRSYRTQTEYISRSGFLLKQTEAVLNYETEEITFKPRWAEEKELLRVAAAIADGHRTNRELTEHPVYGTLEAFIPRLQAILERTLPCDRVAVAFIDNSGNVIAESAASYLPTIHLEPGFIEPLKDTTLGKVITQKRSRIINDLPRHYKEVNQSLATKLILDEGIRSSLTVPIEIRGNVPGFLFVSSVKVDAYTAEHIRFVEKVLNLLKQNLLYHYIIQEILGETTRAFVSLMERKDNETSLHILRMSQYSWAVARELARTEPELTPMKLREIRWFSPLHDIGKIGVPDAVLQKPGGLNEAEREVIEQHVRIGLDVIQSMNRGINRILALDVLTTAEDIISGHHERFDGTGYPAGLKRDEIPLAGRIVALADVFDALTSVRPYKEAFSVEKALEIMDEGVGTHFDPRIFRSFLDAMPEIRRIYDRYKEI